MDQSEARFHLDLKTEALSWTTGMHHLYEYRDEPAIVSLGLLIGHKHPADLPRMNQLVGRVTRHLEPYVYEHRIVTAADTVKTVVVAARPSKVEAGRAVAISGVAINLSAAKRGGSFDNDPTVASLQGAVTNLNQAVDSREVIGQAQGILMERYRVGDEEAFQLLVAVSSRVNRKLRDVAQQLASTGKLPTS